MARNFISCRLPLKTLLGKFIYLQERKGLQSNWQACFACKGKFVGINTAFFKCVLIRKVSQKCAMKESLELQLGQALFQIPPAAPCHWLVGCGWHGVVHVWWRPNQCFSQDNPQGLLCKNSGIVITNANGIMEGDRSGSPALVGDVICHLFLPIETNENSAPAAKCTIANTRSNSWKGSDKCHWTRRPSHVMTGKFHLKGRKVVGTLEGQFYDDTIWKTMTKEQKKMALVPHQQNFSTCS